MKRAPVVLTATAAGLAATLGFSAHPRAPTAAAVTTSTRSAPAAKSSSSSRAATKSATKTVTSDAISTQYGNVQLKLTIAGGRITDVVALQLPSDDPKSVQIGSYAEPQLRQSALAAQSANINVVSGATYTSDGYRTALQSALDKAAASGSTVSAQ